VPHSRMSTVFDSAGCPVARGRGRSQPHRRGAIVIVAIVALCVASALLATMLLRAASERRRMEVEAWETQAEWLAESALQRAAARLAADSGYQGETWAVSAEALGASHAAVVAIEIAGDEEEAGRKTVRVRADYPDHPQHRVRKSKQIVIERTDQGPKS